MTASEFPPLTGSKSNISTLMPVTIPLKTPPEVVKAFESSYHVLVNDLLDELKSDFRLPSDGLIRVSEVGEFCFKYDLDLCFAST
jgi:hypothetical protein